MPPIDPAPPPPPRSSRSATPAETGLASIERILGGIIVLLGLLPSVAVLTGLIDIPPSLQQLVKIVTLPVSVVAILAIVTLRDDIKRWSPRKSVVIVVVCVLLGSVSAVTYFLFAGSHVIEYKKERLVIPINPSQKIKDIIDVYDNQYDQALEHSPRNEELRELLSRESVIATIIMIILMVLSQLLLVAAMVGGAWKLVVGTASPENATHPEE